MKTEKTQNIIREVIEKIPLVAEEIAFSYSDEEQTLWCLIKSKESNFFIGRNGETLAALNHIVRKIIDRSFFENSADTRNDAVKIIVDVNDYQKNKIENLKTLAHALSERAQFFKSSIETDPLPSLERKVIHEFLVNKPNIKTESVGVEPQRRVVIRYSPETAA